MAQAIFDLAGGRVRFKYNCGLGRQWCVLQKTGSKYLNLLATKMDPDFLLRGP
jgi:hypothetical protein